MIFKRKSIIAVFLFSILGSGTALAQWTPTSVKSFASKRADTQVDYYKLDINKVRESLKKAVPVGRNAQPVVIDIPMLSGKIVSFAVYKHSVMAPSIEERYQIGSYMGVGVNDTSVSVRFSVAPNDFQAMIYKDGKYQFIEPVSADKSVYKVFPKTKPSSNGKGFECRATEHTLSKDDIVRLEESSRFAVKMNAHTPSITDRKYRTYRLAISTTGDYTDYFKTKLEATIPNPTEEQIKGAVFAGINATITRVNGIFERDFAIHLDVQDFPNIIFNYDNDPYSEKMEEWSLQLQQTLTTKVGNDKYDIGHLFAGSGGGGFAGDIGNVCRKPANADDNTSKGTAYTSPSDDRPEGDLFDIDFVCHEMGHQFGANHTFSAPSIEGTTAQMEPGSGSSIMGYAGVVSGANVQNRTDPYFHIRSIEQVQEYVSTQQRCGTEKEITNTPPTIGVLRDYSIPKGTPFVLRGEATDVEDSNRLTYNWEQYDNATSVINSVLGNNITGPKFRSIPPTADGNVRYFPRLGVVLDGSLKSSEYWEAVSDVERKLNFSFNVRDNNSDNTQQQVSSEKAEVSVGDDGPFEISTKKINKNILTNLSWSVANTNKSPYNVDNVTIDYSIDGKKWNTLIESTPNDGEEEIDLTDLNLGTNVYVRISAINNIFYTLKKLPVQNAVTCNGDAPDGLEISSVERETAVINWEEVKGAIYKVRYKSATDTKWTEVETRTNSYTLNNLDEGTSYDAQVATICSGSVGKFTNTMKFTTKVLTYCNLKPRNASEGHIANVTISPTKGKEVSNDSTGDGYRDFSTDTDKIITLERGSTGNKIQIKKAWKGTIISNEGISVWIDFNRDGVFSNDEQIAKLPANKNELVSATFDVPKKAYSGNKITKMRVALRYNSPLNTPCGEYSYGDVEDYGVLFTDKLATQESATSRDLQLFPNPTHDILNISKVPDGANYTIFNSAGRVVLSGKIQDGKVVVSRLVRGTYIISIEDNGYKYNLKFVKS